MARSMAILQRGFLSPAEIEASRAVMGLDKTLIADRTYWLASIDETLAGCGGWSRPATLHGGEPSPGLRNAPLLDSPRDPPRVRSVFPTPAFPSPGAGRPATARSGDEGHWEAAGG